MNKLYILNNYIHKRIKNFIFQFHSLLFYSHLTKFIIPIRILLKMWSNDVKSLLKNMDNLLNQEFVLDTISKNLNRIMKEQNLKQKDIAEKANGKITQSSISKVINCKNSVSAYNLLIIAQALDVSIEDLLTSHPEQNETDVAYKEIIMNNDNQRLVTDINDEAFKGYLGDFHLFFYATSGTGTDILHGYINFSKNEADDTCNVYLKLPIGTTKIVNDKECPIIKVYEGNLSISTRTNSGYCYLHCKEIGEICFLIFHHWYLFNNDIKCLMCSAVTTSSGSNRRPTMHRACLTRNDIDLELIPCLKGQLLLNDNNIILSESVLEQIFRDENIPLVFKERLHKAVQKEKYCLIAENLLFDNTIPEGDRIKYISQLRSLSITPKYNKISKRADEALFSLLYK